ncbi:hypothetical protein OGAPHI_005995 [Ogataea philodendri]|uniref:Copper-fist domain-containing protein n=1 Tax=Ogataea philodendri TaxID=1378263 RepID=A0A9P8NYB9_9ASCO|nr:uncharacterized protein OGAPHI_005995 [Ogataea philodendri]KAH3661817.1 hypothetical protein OGAPHI_005995 [Ogataea philodendri]
MVLINGVKYACERCIRGHRVTTCTHVDQPMMMIKPKGRPSTQCNHCKQQRKLKNAHIACTCNSKTKEHHPSCACHVDGECTCSAKVKKPTSKKKDDDQRTASMSSLSLGPEKDSLNNIIQSWDMASPPIGASDSYQQSDSLASLNSVGSDKLSGFQYQHFTKRQVGTDPLQNFRASTPNTQQKKVGEIMVPMDEYVAPLNTMNNNFSTLMSSFNSNTDSPVVGEAVPNSDQKYSQSVADPFQGINGSGSGLLDSFDDTNSSRMYQNRNRNVSSGSIISSPRDPINPDSLFPLFPLIGPSQSQSSLPSPPSQQSLNDLISSQPSSQNLSHSNLSSHNNKNVSTYPQVLKKNLTGSSTHSIGSVSHSHHHHGTHGHAHLSHFSPYPQHVSSQQPRRSNSFLSISSSNTVSSSLGSPSSVMANERPPLVSANSTDSLNGFQLTNSKTNTTLMDDLYQTKTYTDQGPKPFSIVPEETDSGSTPASDASQRANPVFEASTIGTIPITSSHYVKKLKEESPDTAGYSSYLGNIDYLDSLLEQSQEQGDLANYVDLQGDQADDKS